MPTPSLRELQSTAFAAALRRRYRTPTQVMRVLGLDEALLENPAEIAEPKSRGIIGIMARLAARCSSEEWAQLQNDLRSFAGGTEAEDDQVPQGLAVDPDTKTTDLPLVDGMDRIVAMDGRPAASGKLDHAGLLNLVSHIKANLY